MDIGGEHGRCKGPETILDYLPDLSGCPAVSGSTRTITLPDLPWGSCELWVTASTIAGQGPSGPSLWLHLQGRGAG